MSSHNVKRRGRSEEGRKTKMELDWLARDGFLFNAVNSNDAAAVQEAIRHGANVNCVGGTYQNDTPLMKACEHGYDEIVRILLDAGADARWKNDWGSSAIGNACSGGRLSTLQLLLRRDKSLLDFADDKGWTPLSLAINSERVDLVRCLLDRGANAHASTQDGYTVLMHACCTSLLEIVRLLLDAGADMEARDENQETALHHLARKGGTYTFRELVRHHNANMCSVDRKGRTPFDLTIHEPENAWELLSFYSSKMVRDHGSLALHVILKTTEYTYVENAEFHPPMKPLLQIRSPLGTLTLRHFRNLLFNQNLIRHQDENGKLPVHVAIRNNAPVEVLCTLVEIDVTTLHIADHAGALPLHECCCGVVDDSSVRHLLVQGGVGTLAVRTQEGALPLHVLCGSTNPSSRTVHYMIQSFPGAVTARTNAGNYPFVIAACESSTASLSVVYELVRAYPGLIVSN